MKFGSNLVLIDGAFNRKSFASPSISDGTILVTGAAYSKNIWEVIEETNHVVSLLSIPKVKDEKLIESLGNLKNVKLSIINKEYNNAEIDVHTTLDVANEISEHIQEDTKCVYLGGVITDKVLKDLMKITDKYRGVTFLIKDGTKLFFSKELFNKFTQKGAIFRTINPINIICVIANPYSLSDEYWFDKIKFLELLKDKLNKWKIPIFDLGVSKFSEIFR
jgi:hypothetical protein